MECPTLRIKAPTQNGFIVINKEDFNPEIHVLYDASFAPAVETEQPVELGKPKRGAK